MLTRDAAIRSSCVVFNFSVFVVRHKSNASPMRDSDSELESHQQRISRTFIRNLNTKFLANLTLNDKIPHTNRTEFGINEELQYVASHQASHCII